MSKWGYFTGKKTWEESRNRGDEIRMYKELRSPLYIYISSKFARTGLIILNRHEGSLQGLIVTTFTWRI
jgi:hypothetical protein